MTDRIEEHSPTWRIVSREAEARLETARVQLEAHGVDAARAEFLRGQIATWRTVLRLADEPVTISTGAQ